MALPKIDNPTYTLELPSTGEVVKYRPFLVKEQKVLMLAQQSDKPVDRNNAILQIIESCTFGKVNGKNPLFDIEYVFLKLRAKSAGETVNVTLTCPDDNETKDTVKINLEDVDVNMTDNHTNKINITDKVTMTMRYPLINDIDENVKESVEGPFKVLKNCIESIDDGDKIHTKADFSDKELEDFLNSFNTDQLTNVMNFFNTMPKLRHPVKVKNKNTGVESEVILEGLENFL
tara:strand:+ start:159 stop:854 length:696 start_codon:yes stop_codon:yes gene_type:complete